MGGVSNYDILVFDMEDALIDRSKSRCAAVSRGVDAYLVRLLGVEPAGGPVFNPAEVEEFVRAQGIDSAVDAMHALLVAALHWLPMEFSEADFGGYDGPDLLQAVRASGRLRVSLGELARLKNLPEFQKILRSRGGGIRGLGRARGLRNRFLALAEGHIMMDNFVKRILAEAYLGEELFVHEHGQPRQFVTEDGAIDLETSWLDPADVATLRKRCPLGAVTSRSQSEAQHVLTRLDLQRYLEVVVGRGSMGMGMMDADEARWIRSLGVVESMEADYPTKVTEAIERLRGLEDMQTAVRVAYVGNCLPDERGLVPLKERYRLTLVGCAIGLDRKAVTQMKEKGADFVVTEPGQLVRVLSERPRPRSGPPY